MALLKPTPPESVRRALAVGVADFLDRRDPFRRVLLQAPLALHVFTLGLDDISYRRSRQVEAERAPSDAGRILAEAKSAGWRFLAATPSGVIAGDVTESRAGKAPRMTAVSRDPLVGKAIQATHELETLREADAKHYQLQVLRIPGILLEAFWLKSLTDDIDLFVPVLTRSERLARMQPYTLQELLVVGRELADEFRRFEDGYGEYQN